MKCKNCKREIINAPFTKVLVGQKRKSSFCNEECYNQFISKDNTDNNPRRKLTDYIQELYVKNGYKKEYINWALISKQIKNIEKDLNINDNWIRYCLWYLVEIKEQSLFDEKYDGSILNLVPYSYVEARKYWEDIQRIKNAFDKIDFEDNTIDFRKAKFSKLNKKNIGFE